MSREFVPFDEAVIDAEFAALTTSSARDTAKLEYCIERYENSGYENPHPAIIKSFEEGSKELRHFKSDFAGRILYYEAAGSTSKTGGKLRLIILRVFRKEGNDTPMRERRIAEARMKGHQSSQRSK